MEELFLKILKMSIASSYVILIVMLVRLLLKRFPKIFSYMLWLVVLFRLICPFSFESNISLIPKNYPVSLESKIISDNSANTYIQNTNSTTENYSNTIEVNKENTNSLNIISISSKLWITAVLFMMLYSTFSIVKLKKALRFSIHIDRKSVV